MGLRNFLEKRKDSKNIEGLESQIEAHTADSEVLLLQYEMKQTQIVRAREQILRMQEKHTSRELTAKQKKHNSVFTGVSDGLKFLMDNADWDKDRRDRKTTARQAEKDGRATEISNLEARQTSMRTALDRSRTAQGAGHAARVQLVGNRATLIETARMLGPV